MQNTPTDCQGCTPSGIRISALYEVGADADNVYDSRMRIEYPIDSQNVTGSPQVVRKTEINASGGRCRSAGVPVWPGAAA